jgi:hypothetical protein
MAHNLIVSRKTSSGTLCRHHTLPIVDPLQSSVQKYQSKVFTIKSHCYCLRSAPLSYAGYLY